MTVLLALVGVAFVCYGFLIWSVGHFNANVIFPILFGLPLIVNLFVCRTRIGGTAAYRWIKLFFIVCYCLYIIAFAVCTTLIFTCPTDTDDTQAAIVLGAGLKYSQPTKTLALRLNKALEYSEQNPEAYIVVSGGLGNGEKITEAQAMKTYLVKKGLDESRIIMEGKARNTSQNLSYSKALLDEKLDQPYKVAVITSDFHMYRALMTAKEIGLEAAGMGSQSLWYLIPSYLMRETVVIIRNVLFGSDSFSELSAIL